MPKSGVVDMYDRDEGNGKSGGAGISRRRFLRAAACAGLGSALLAGTRGAAWAMLDPTERVKLEGFRPRPQVKVLAAVLRLPPPYWLGWPGAAYDVEAHTRDYQQQFLSAARRVGVHLRQLREPVENEKALNAFIQRVSEVQPDAVLVTLQHMAAWKWADAVARAFRPTIIFAPVGTAFTGHVAEISRRPGVHVISSLDVAAVEQAMRMIRAKRQFEEARLLVVAGHTRHETVLERLGTKVRYIPRRRLHELFQRVPVTDEVREVARHNWVAARKIVEPSWQDMLNAARSFVTAKLLMQEEEANAITTDCLGMVMSKLVPTPPCLAASLFQDGGTTYGCEADVFGAISLMLTSYLLDKPGFMNDPVPDTARNLLIVAHCTCATRLSGLGGPREPFILRSHSESNLGVSTQVLWRVGQPVTLVRFQDPNRLILDTGTVVANINTPPAGGCRTSVALRMDRIEDVRDVLGFHQVVFYGNHRRDIEAFCQMYGIEVIHSPERARGREEA